MARYERPATGRRRPAGLHPKVASQVGDEEAAIFRAHESILHDPTFTAKIRRGIVDDRLTAPAALDRLLSEYTRAVLAHQGRVHQGAAGRRRDVVIRLSGHLTDVLQPQKRRHCPGR